VAVVVFRAGVAQSDGTSGRNYLNSATKSDNVAYRYERLHAPAGTR
jgi:hypothetical protein